MQKGKKRKNLRRGAFYIDKVEVYAHAMHLLAAPSFRKELSLQKWGFQHTCQVLLRDTDSCCAAPKLLLQIQRRFGPRSSTCQLIYSWSGCDKQGHGPDHKNCSRTHTLADDQNPMLQRQSSTSRSKLPRALLVGVFQQKVFSQDARTRECIQHPYGLITSQTRTACICQCHLPPQHSLLTIKGSHCKDLTVYVKGFTGCRLRVCSATVHNY